MGIIASIGVNTFLQDYQKQRLLTFVNPLTDPLGAGYNIIQSQIAVGSGGVFGKGLFSASQSRLGFLPEQHTDFIFSAIGEKCGFFGSIVILLLYSVIIYRALNIAASTQDMFGLLMIIGVVSVLVTQIFVNIGMTIGIMPVIGLPLPFISYGGSFLFITMIEMGIICNIATSRVRL
jgi:rod shape determining protein RodA